MTLTFDLENQQGSMYQVWSKSIEGCSVHKDVLQEKIDPLTFDIENQQGSRLS